MLRLILVGSLLTIGYVSNVPDGLPRGLWNPDDPLNQNAVEEYDERPRIPKPDNKEAEDEVQNMIVQLNITTDDNDTATGGHGQSPRPSFVDLTGHGQSYANMGPRNSMRRNGTNGTDGYNDFAENILGLQDKDGGKHVDVHNLKIFGEFGKNYFTEFGKPYINCAVSDYERPLLEALNSTNSRTKKCFLEWGRSFERLACMAVFMYKGTEEQLKGDKSPRDHMVVQNQNCWTNQDAAIESCTKAPNCMFNGMIEAGKQHFCCCNEHNCNDIINFDPNGKEENTKAKLLKEKKEKEAKARQIAADAEAEHRRQILILLAVVALIAIAALGLVTFFICRWKAAKRREEAQANAAGGGQAQPLIAAAAEAEAAEAPPPPPEKLWEVINSSLEEIGQGKYGRVYKAQFRERPDAPLMTVAVKTFKSGSISSFNNELAIYNDQCMKKCLKNSILRLLEADIQEKFLVTEYCEMGNLHNYLENSIIEQTADSISLVQSLLEALTFLHEERGSQSPDPKPVILHRDVKSHNVLLKMDSRNRIVAVLMDFGLSLKCSQKPEDAQSMSNHMHKVVGTQRYMAPELLIGSAELDIPHFKAIDVYALALVLWEVLTRTRVLPDEDVPRYTEPLERELRREQPHDVLRLSTYRQVVANRRVRPTFRKSIREHKHLGRIVTSVEEMWEHDAGCRVSAACVMKRMEALNDEGYHSQSGTMNVPGSLRSADGENSAAGENSTAERTPPSSARSSAPSDNNTVVYETDETAPPAAPDATAEAARLLGAPARATTPSQEQDGIEMEMR